MESLISRSRSTGCERRRPSLNGEIMTIKTLSPGLGVSPQIGPADVAALAASGFRPIICNRPDDEERGQPSSVAGAAEDDELGLRFIHIPVVSSEGRRVGIQGVRTCRSWR